MRDILYTVAVVCIVLWVIGFLGFNLGGLVHILFAIAIIALLLRIIKGNSPLI
ncbi:MAG: hypothetical protein RLY16_2256 [Bacteroidota bacterium]|jgi:hypothetical protein